MSRCHRHRRPDFRFLVLPRYISSSFPMGVLRRTLWAGEDSTLSLYYSSCNRQTKRLGDPVANVITAHGAIVCFAMLDCVIVGREDAQFALRAIDRLFIGLVRELDGNLTITRPMRDEKRNSNLVDYAVEAHRGRPGHESVAIGLAKYPRHVVPALGSRVLALAVTTALRQLA